MPIYLFRCVGCKAEIELNLTFEDNLRKTCPECGKPMAIVPFPPAVIFKGSGFTKKAIEPVAEKPKKNPVADIIEE